MAKGGKDQRIRSERPDLWPSHRRFLRERRRGVANTNTLSDRLAGVVRNRRVKQAKTWKRIAFEERQQGKRPFQSV